MEKELYKNKQAFLSLLGESADIKKKSMQLGKDKDIDCFIAYVEVTGGSFLFESTVIGKLLNQFCLSQSLKGCPEGHSFYHFAEMLDTPLPPGFLLSPTIMESLTMKRGHSQ